jgi:uncharacterized protein YicC (UPF0701 family)
VQKTFALFAFGLGSVVLGCGRPATEEDCNKVVEKNVEVQMRKMNITDPTAVGREKERIRASLQPQIKQCIGRRVTESIMRCVDRAETPEELDRCMH